MKKVTLKINIYGRRKKASYLLFGVTMFFSGFLKEWKNDFFKMLNSFLHIGPMVFHECHDEIKWEIKDQI